MISDRSTGSFTGQRDLMKFSVFLKKGFYLLAILAIFLTFLTLFGILETGKFAAWSGLSISFLNFIIGSAIVAWGTGKSDKHFYSAFFGGMFLRFLGVFILLFILIKYVQFDQNTLIVALLASYFCFLGLEIWIIYQLSLKKGDSV